MKKQLFIVAALLAVTASKPAAAYIGPGIAIALLGYVSWPIAVLVGILSIFVVFPLRYVYRRFIAKKETHEAPPQDKDSSS
jgi:hypothetical protein